ncbi:unnamed protein product [Effrenium voratum]|nr:unnamed protein product [Effrenium voratum]
MTTSSWVILANQRLIKEAGFPYPILLSALGAQGTSRATGSGTARSASLILWHYLDTDPFKVRYVVYGRPEIAPVQRDFLHIQRMSTFTVWSNITSSLFFCCSAVLGFLGHETPPALCTANQVLWELTFPLAFFVNIVVTFVLIPSIKKMRDMDKLDRILRLRPQLLHNGLALAAAMEAVLAAPPLAIAHFPVLVLFGTVYVVFSWYFFMQTGIFHYMFLDHRFQYQPLALLLLLALLAAVYCVGSVALTHATSSAWARLGILVFALGTCTWRKGELSPNQSSFAKLLAS